MIWLLAHPIPLSRQFARQTGRLRKRDNLLTGGGEGGGRGVEPYDRKKAWSFINQSILSVGIGKQGEESPLKNLNRGNLASSLWNNRDSSVVKKNVCNQDNCMGKLLSSYLLGPIFACTVMRL
jgi:hypothetical protein